MSTIKVTYNLSQDIKNTNSFQEILRDLKTWGATKVSAHRNYRFEIIEVHQKALQEYCSIKELDFWQLIFNVITLCQSYKSIEEEAYGEAISNIENVHCIIEADETISNYNVPLDIYSTTGVNEEGDEVIVGHSFLNVFGTSTQTSEGNMYKSFETIQVEEGETPRVRFTPILNARYLSKEHLSSLYVFSINNPQFNIEFKLI